MPNIAKEAIHLRSDSIVLGDSFIIKGILQFRQRLDRLLGNDLLHKAYSHNKDITSDKFNDNGKKEIKATGRQQEQQRSLQLSQQQGKQHSQQHCMQYEWQHRQHQDQQFERHQGLQHNQHLGLQHSQQQGLQIESQHRLHQDRHLGYNFIHEIIYLPLV